MTNATTTDGEERWTSPSGAEWSVVDRTDGVCTLQLEVTPDGHATTLRNTQTFTTGEMDAGAGWVRL